MSSKYIAVSVILLLIIGGGAFYGGTTYEKSSLSKQGLLRSGNMQGANGERRGPGQGGPSGFGRNGGPSGNFVAGEVIAKDDKSITVKTQDGGSKIVFFSDTTTVGKTVPGSSSDLSVGEQVMANGQASPDGSLAAQNIQIRPSQANQPN